MRDYVSVGRASRNENGFAEVTIERRFTIFEHLDAIIKARSLKISDRFTVAWELKDSQWVNKETGEKPNDEERDEIAFINSYLDATDLYWN